MATNDAGAIRGKAGKPWIGRVRRIGVSLLICYMLYGGAMMALQDRFIFPRDVCGKRDAMAPVPRGWEQMTITAEDGSVVPAWLALPARVGGVGGGEGERVPVVVFFHGNAELIDDIAGSSLASIYRGMGVGVLLVEFRGYGRAGGNPSQKAIVADAVKFYDLLAARPEVDKERIAYYGRSLGGGVACAVAMERRPRAMVLQSTFTSVASMAVGMGIPGFLVRHPFRNDEAVAKLDAPILFMHGSRDSIIPCAHSEALLRLAKRGKLAKQACDHNDFPSDLEAYRADIAALLRENGIGR